MSHRPQRSGATALSRAVRQGQLQPEPRLLSVTSDFLVALHQVLAAMPDGALEPLYQTGELWGKAWFGRLEAQARHYGESVRALPMTDFQQVLHDDLFRCGWGRAVFDMETHAAKGLMVISVFAGPVSTAGESVGQSIAMLQAGFFAGVFSELSEIPMAGLGFRWDSDLPFVQAVVAHEKRISQIWARMESGGSWAEALSVA